MNDFRARVESERPYLLRYASLQLRDRAAAEDAVQETLVAALAGEAGFRAERVWRDARARFALFGLVAD